MILCTVTAERSQIARLFQNLISNAIKYRSPDRLPKIHVPHDQTESIGLSPSKTMASGSDKTCEAIFSPFTRLHGREYSGSGVGLAICRRIVERYGGRIWAESTVNEGSTFHFMVPQQRGDEQ